MKLYNVDCQLAWCRYYLACSVLDKARGCWEKAKALITVTGYHLRIEALAALQTCLF